MRAAPPSDFYLMRPLSWLCIVAYSFRQQLYSLQVLLWALVPASSKLSLSLVLLKGVGEMASRIVVKRFTSQLPKWDSLLHEQVKASAAGRAFATSAARAQSDSAVDVGHTSKEPSAGVSCQNRGWPRSLFPSLLNPFYQPTSLTQMMDTMDRLFDLPLLSGSPSLMRNNTNRIPWDVMEDEKCFKLRVDMPGMSKEDVKLCVEDGDLIMKAEQDAEKKEDDWSSRSYGSYNIRIKIPENVDSSGIKAEMKDGVLKVLAPKVEGGKQKHEVQIE